MAQVFEFKGLEEMRAAVRSNPEVVRSEVGKFLVRGLAAYRRVIFNNPWRMGSTGGGAPVRPGSGNLRATHEQTVGPWEARIFPTASYAPYVHGIDGYPRTRTYQLRPWLDYAVQKSKPEIEALEGSLLDNVLAALAK